MQQRYFLLLIILLTLQLFSLTSSGQENYEIRKITFQGNATLDDDFLLDALIIHPINFLEKIFTKKEASLYNLPLIENDIQRLQRSYQREGFLNVKIELLPPAINDKKRIVDLSFQIKENQPVKNDSIQFLLAGDNPQLNTDSLFREVSKTISVKKGERFSDEKLISDLNLLKIAFQNNGYTYAKADYLLDIDTTRHQVSVNFRVNPGPECYFGETILEGNEHVKEKFLREQLTYKEGEIYSSEKLDETRKNMYKLQLFSILSVQPQTSKQHTSPIPIKFFIDEAQRFSSKYGLGYGTEDKFRAFLEMNYKGFISGARRLNLQIKHSALTPYEINFNWIQPQFMSPKLSATINPFITRIKEPGYNIRDLGINLKFSYEFNDYLTGNLTYYYEKVRQYYDPNDTTTVNQEDLPYNKSGFLYSLMFDNSKPKFSAEKGFNILLAYKLNGYLFGGDYDYSRVWTDIRNYQKIGDWVLASRLMAGGIKSADASRFIPVEDRFYAGGSNSVRGWDRSELGPLRDSGSPLGGSSVLQGSIELRIPIVWKISLVTFLDYGNVWVDEFHYKLNDLAYASGGGVRFDTPIGPIRFDVGVPVWNEKRSAQFFISVGQAF